jgi:excisionase family DNA binding protein
MSDKDMPAYERQSWRCSNMNASIQGEDKMTSITSRTFFQAEPLSVDDAVCVRRSKAAEMLAISVSTLDRLVKTGELTCLKLPGRVLFRVDTLRTWAHSKESCNDPGRGVTKRSTNPKNASGLNP